MNDDFLTVAEAAAYLKRTKGNIYNLVFQKKLKHFKPGGKCLLFRRADLQAWVEAGAILTDDEVAERAANRS